MQNECIELKIQEFSPSYFKSHFKSQLSNHKNQQTHKFINMTVIHKPLVSSQNSRYQELLQTDHTTNVKHKQINHSARLIKNNTIRKNQINSIENSVEEIKWCDCKYQKKESRNPVEISNKQYKTIENSKKDQIKYDDDSFKQIFQQKKQHNKTTRKPKLFFYNFLNPQLKQ